MEILRQISVDNFAKRINAGLNPQGFSEDNLNLISNVPSGEDGNIPREFKIKSSELPALIQAEKEKLDKKDYKWRGHGWTRCDFELLNSFNRQQDEVKRVWIFKDFLIFFDIFLEI